jgi:hypothetical protein
MIDPTGLVQAAPRRARAGLAGRLRTQTDLLFPTVLLTRTYAAVAFTRVV